MLSDLIDSLSDIISGLGDSYSNDDFSSINDYLSTQGIDLSNYTADEIKEALDIAFRNDATLDIQDADLESLHDKASGVEHVEHRGEVSFEGRRVCATRHGCTGIAACDYSYGAPS